MLIGAGINTIRGIYSSFKIRKTEKDLVSELGTELWAGLSGYEQFEFRNTLLMTETIQKLETAQNSTEKFNILENTLRLMKNEITQAETALKNTAANKLDIATLAVNVQDLTLNTLKELETMNRKIEEMEKKQRTSRIINLFFFIVIFAALGYLLNLQLGILKTF